jgi:hypothetical protein
LRKGDIVFMDYRGPKESLLWLQAEEPDMYAMFAEALKPAADLSAIRQVVDAVTALADASSKGIDDPAKELNQRRK